MFNPNNISTKAALFAIVGNGIEAVRKAPSAVTTAVANAKSAQSEKQMKSKMDVIKELNEVEKTIADLIARGVTGSELTIAQSYATTLRAKL